MRRGKMSKFVSKFSMKLDYFPVLFRCQGRRVHVAILFDQHAKVSQLFFWALAFEGRKPIEHLGS